MAKKKVTHHHPHQPKDSIPNKEEACPPPVTAPKQEPMEQDPSEEKLQSLKSLNSLLVKETFDRRQQVESLEQAKVALEAEIALFGEEKRVLEAALTRSDHQIVEVELERAVFCVFLVTQMGQMAVEFGKVEEQREAEVLGLKRNLGELSVSLENEKAILGEAVRERELAKRECGSWIEKVNEMRENLEEVERARGALKEGFKKLKVEHERLVIENHESGKAFEGLKREKDSLVRDLARAAEEIGQLMGEMEGLLNEKKDLEDEKNRQSVIIIELEKVVRELKELVVTMQEEKRLQGELLLLERRYTMEKEREKEVLREVEALDRDNKEKEASIMALKGERDLLEKKLEDAVKELEDKGWLMEETIRKKIEIEEENSHNQSVVSGLNMEVSELRNVISSLELSYGVEKDKNEAFLSEAIRSKEEFDRLLIVKDGIEKDLDEARVDVDSLNSKVLELEMKIKEILGELLQKSSEHEKLALEKAAFEHKFEILRREKESVDKRLSDSERSAGELLAKIELEGLKSERALTFLKSTASFLNKGENLDEPKMKEDIQPFVRELEAIKNTFQLKELVMDDMKRQLEFVQDSLVKAEKKKGLWTLLSSAATLFVAASVAYLARAR
ncbi:hypothetical protein SAY87_003504 [Trapa incisa]|uniref:Uncharacterized protein n=1 Tax=Trapa incisa TaxID=236973 RepID=A0AAN7QJ99_9MYRT|nr:hypothetical protein SAY87_003504 [Trapa incisa]